MLEIDRLTDASHSIGLGFVEREATPKPLMQPSIHLHAAELSLPDTVDILDSFGVKRARSTVHNWIQKADLQPIDGKNPDHVAVDETVIQPSIWTRKRMIRLSESILPIRRGTVRPIHHGRTEAAWKDGAGPNQPAGG